MVNEFYFAQNGKGISFPQRDIPDLNQIEIAMHFVCH